MYYYIVQCKHLVWNLGMLCKRWYLDKSINNASISNIYVRLKALLKSFKLHYEHFNYGWKKKEIYVDCDSNIINSVGFEFHIG